MSDEERARVKKFLKDNPEEVERLQHEIGIEHENELLRKENTELKSNLKRTAISHGKKIAKLEKEINKYRAELGLPEKAKKKKGRRKKKDDNAQINNDEEAEEEHIEEDETDIIDDDVIDVSKLQPVEPLFSPTEEKPEKKKSLSKRAKEIEKDTIKDKPKKKTTMLNIIWDNQNEKTGTEVCALHDLYEEGEEKGIPKDEIEALLKELKTEGRVYEKHPGSLRTPTQPDDKGFFD